MIMMMPTPQMMMMQNCQMSMMQQQAEACFMPPRMVTPRPSMLGAADVRSSYNQDPAGIEPLPMSDLDTPEEAGSDDFVDVFHATPLPNLKAVLSKMKA